MDKKQKLSTVMRAKRRERNLTQEEAAELLDVSVRWYRKVECGRSKPGFTLICEIAWLFDINFADFSDKKNSAKKQDRKVVL